MEESREYETAVRENDSPLKKNIRQRRIYLSLLIENGNRSKKLRWFSGMSANSRIKKFSPYCGKN